MNERNKHNGPTLRRRIFCHLVFTGVSGNSSMFEDRKRALRPMNDRSSRSHVVIQLTITQTEVVGRVGRREVSKTRRSRLN